MIWAAVVLGSLAVGFLLRGALCWKLVRRCDPTPHYGKPPQFMEDCDAHYLYGRWVWIMRVLPSGKIWLQREPNKADRAHFAIGALSWNWLPGNVRFYMQIAYVEEFLGVPLLSSWIEWRQKKKPYPLPTKPPTLEGAVLHE